MSKELQLNAVQKSILTLLSATRNTKLGMNTFLSEFPDIQEKSLAVDLAELEDKQLISITEDGKHAVTWKGREAIGKGVSSEDLLEVGDKLISNPLPDQSKTSKISGIEVRNGDNNNHNHKHTIRAERRKHRHADNGHDMGEIIASLNKHP